MVGSHTAMKTICWHIYVQLVEDGTNSGPIYVQLVEDGINSGPISCLAYVEE
jgi:hypothetical protein